MNITYEQLHTAAEIQRDIRVARTMLNASAAASHSPIRLDMCMAFVLSTALDAVQTALDAQLDTNQGRWVELTTRAATLRKHAEKFRAERPTS